MHGETQVGRRVKRWLWASLGWAAVTGCVFPPDAGPEDVLVKGFDRYHSTSGLKEKPMDFSTQPLELFVLEGGNFTRMTGTALEPGRYVFKEVPAGTYYLKQGTSYTITDARTVDLSTHWIGRPDALELSAGSQFTALLNIEGLEPWPDSSRTHLTDMQVLSEELGSMGQLQTRDRLQEGQTSVRGEEVAYGSVTRQFRFEASQGDRAWVTQAMPRPAGMLSDGRLLESRSVVRSLHLAPLSFDGVQAFPVSGTFQALSMRQLPVDWRLASFMAHAQQAHPAATAGTSYLYLSPAQYGLASGWVGYTGELLWLDMPQGYSSDFQGQLTFGNPYPASWELVGQVASFFRTRLTVPGATSQVTLSASITVGDTAAALSARPIEPKVLPPRNLRLDGEDASVSGPLALGSHLLSWEHPAAGPPQAYRLTVYQYTVRNGIAQRTTAARFSLNGRFTSLLLQPDLLQPGSHYVFFLNAIASPEYTVEDQNTLWRPPYSTASTLSGMLSTP